MDEKGLLFIVNNLKTLLEIINLHIKDRNITKVLGIKIRKHKM